MVVLNKKSLHIDEAITQYEGEKSSKSKEIEKPLKVQLYELMIDTEIDPSKVYLVFKAWSERVIPLNPYTVQSIIEKTDMSRTQLSVMRTTLREGARYQDRANMQRYKLEYLQSCAYLDETLNDMKKGESLQTYRARVPLSTTLENQVNVFAPPIELREPSPSKTAEIVYLHNKSSDDNLDKRVINE